ncbi:hypothetical protein ASA1KI_02200 [Opitutales bacterium ASA1]|uniref:hypothetical protein n=1 Tax=Congregicoccus parvus TaxID=3081749 RepID=UPI002B2F169E|nr:hypothetical protein ASA1KI_02200 [Opitutales bacterium ASA1]
MIPRSIRTTALFAVSAPDDVRLFAEDENGATSLVGLPMVPYDFASPNPSHPLHRAISTPQHEAKHLVFYLEGRVPASNVVVSLVRRNAQGTVVERDDVHMNMIAARPIDLVAQFHGAMDQEVTRSKYRRLLQDATNLLRNDRDGPNVHRDVPVPATFRTPLLHPKDDDPAHAGWKNPASLAVVEVIFDYMEENGINLYCAESLFGNDGLARRNRRVMIVRSSPSFAGVIAHEWVHAIDAFGTYGNHVWEPGNLMAPGGSVPAGGNVTEDQRDLLLQGWP